jgi:hypothetical protein
MAITIGVYLPELAALNVNTNKAALTTSGNVCTPAREIATTNGDAAKTFQSIIGY